MATIYHDRTYTPNSFLIVADGADYRDESQSVLIQASDDFIAISAVMGSKAIPQDEHQYVDHYTDYVNSAWEYIMDHQGESFADLDEYLSS